MPGNHRHCAQSGTEGQGAHIAHEDLSGIRVKPEKAQPGTGHCAAEHGQLATACHVRDVQVIGELHVAHQIGNDAECRTHQYGWKDGETIKPVRQVNRVTGPHDHKIRQQQEQRPHLPGEVLEEGNVQLGGYRGIEGCIQVNGYRNTRSGLPEILPARRQSSRVFLDHLAIVINPAHCAKHNRHQQH